MKSKDRRRTELYINRTPNRLYKEPSRGDKHSLNTINSHFAVNGKNEAYLCRCSHSVWVRSCGGIKVTPNRKGWWI